MDEVLLVVLVLVLGVVGRGRGMGLIGGYARRRRGVVGRWREGPSGSEVLLYE